jgi:hypothetical protein
MTAVSVRRSDARQIPMNLLADQRRLRSHLSSSYVGNTDHQVTGRSDHLLRYAACISCFAVTQKSRMSSAQRDRDNQKNPWYVSDGYASDVGRAKSNPWQPRQCTLSIPSVSTKFNSRAFAPLVATNRTQDAMRYKPWVYCSIDRP